MLQFNNPHFSILFIVGFFMLSGISLTSAISCPAGQYQPFSGSNFCMSCPSGQFQPSVGQTACIVCGAGYSSSGSMASCTPCAAGQYFIPYSWTFANVISDCSGGDLGFYSGGSPAYSPPISMCYSGGPTGVAACWDGVHQLLNGGSSVGCYVKSITSAYTNAQNCVGGANPGFIYTCGAGAQCVSCPAGTYQATPGSSGLSACISCPVGTYASSAGHSACVACSSGYFTASIGSTSCSSCPTGQFQLTTGQTSCSSCGAGTYPTYVWSFANVISDCPGGDALWTYGASVPPTSTCGGSVSASGVTVCWDGTAHKINGGSTPTCTYKSSTYPTVSSCVGGGNPGYIYQCLPTGCSNCSPGQYQPFAGKSFCMACPTGQYQPNSGQTACVVCPTGTSSSSSSSACAACTLGQYFIPYSWTFADVISDCSGGDLGFYTGGNPPYSPPVSLCYSGGPTGVAACWDGVHQLLNGGSSVGCYVKSITSAYTNAQNCVGGANPGFIYTCGAGAQCVSCPAGQYTYSAGLSGLASCISCPSGKCPTTTASPSQLPSSAPSTSSILAALSPSQFTGVASFISGYTVSGSFSTPLPYGVAENTANTGWAWAPGDYFIVDFLAPTNVISYSQYSVNPSTSTGCSIVFSYSDNGLTFTTALTWIFATSAGGGVNDNSTPRTDTAGWYSTLLNVAAKHRYWMVQAIAVTNGNCPPSGPVRFYVGFFTASPTLIPSYSPSSPTHRPTHPTFSPTVTPSTRKPTLTPSKLPTRLPSFAPTKPSLSPTSPPTVSSYYFGAFTTTQGIYSVNQTTLSSAKIQSAFLATMEQLLNPVSPQYAVSVQILSVVVVNSKGPTPIYGYVYNTTYVVPNGLTSKLSSTYQSLTAAISTATSSNVIATNLLSTCGSTCGLPSTLSVNSAGTSMTSPVFIQTPTPTIVPTSPTILPTPTPTTNRPSTPTLKPSFFPTNPTVPPSKRPSWNPSIKPSRAPSPAPSIHSLGPTIQGQCFCNVRVCVAFKNVTKCAPRVSTRK